jgi:SAM-dependent methyltransferase
VGEWWQTFFDLDYFRLWEGAEGPERTEREVTGIWTLLGLHAGSRVLDAPCGYGRIARALALRGAAVLGLDFSSDLIEEAERARGDVTLEQLKYRRADLRERLLEQGFDVALNIFSSVGYSSEEDDIRVFSALRAAVRPGGLVFVETAHRDWVAAGLNSRGWRLPDGTLMLEEPRFDSVSGRVDSTWSWSGPCGSGRKSSTVRSYNATELARLIGAAGLRLQSVHDGCSAAPFVGTGPGMSRRLGLLAVRD